MAKFSWDKEIESGDQIYCCPGTAKPLKRKMKSKAMYFIGTG
jgi:hypothetical protein